MSSTLTAYITIVCVSAVLNLLLTVYVIAKRNLYGRISTFFILSVGATTVYCFAYAFSLTSSTLEQLRFWSVMQYIGMPFAPPLGMLFVLHYLGHKLSGWRIAAMLTIPSVSLLSNATNEWHHLHYKSYRIHEMLGAPYNDIEVGPTYIVMGCYILVCMLTSLFLLYSRWSDTASSYRPQLFSLMCAQLIPMVTSFLYLVGVTPEGIDPVPMVVGVSSILMWWAIESSRLLTIIPIAKDTIFHSIGDGVIVLDKPGRLVEYNDGCTRMFRRLDRSMFGQPLEKVWSAMFGTAETVPKLTAGPQELEVVVNGSEERYYQVRISPLKQKARSSMAGTVMIISDISELKLMQQQLERHAYYDELTQIFNRRAFFDRCEQVYRRAYRDSAPFATILFDIDHFKKINDTYGHQAGDQALVHVARICSSCLTEDTLFARYGGEEFVLALFGRTASDGRQLAEMLRRRIAAQPLIVNGTEIRITSSFGVAEASEHEGKSLQQLLHSTDQALYAAKRGGRNQVCVYEQLPT